MIWILTFPHAEAWGDSTRGDTELISVSVDFPAIPRIRNTSSYNPSISHDGLRVAFDSDAPDLVENDANGQIADVFLRDRVQSATTIISASSSGVQGNAGSYDPAGRAFQEEMTRPSLGMACRWAFNRHLQI